jgi:hypothetical protein
MAADRLSNQGPIGPRELASGIDTLIISLRGELPDLVALDLANAKADAIELQTAVEVIFGGVAWQVQPWSFGKYPFNLSHEFGFLGITTSKALPTMRWQPRAEALHGFGPSAIAQWLINLTESEVGPMSCTVSRIDLHADFQGLFFNADDKESFICRARSCKAVWDEGVFSGFTFGSRGSKAASARIYDKSLEIVKKGGTYWYEVWNNAFDPGETVWRIEFEFHRGFLRKFGIDSLDQAFISMGGLWKYATEEWLSLRIQTLDETHSRWPVEPTWQAIQGASLTSNAIGLERVRIARRNDDLHRTIPQVNGWLARLGAILGHESTEDVIDSLPQIVELYERSSKIKFGSRIDRKRKEMGLP